MLRNGAARRSHEPFVGTVPRVVNPFLPTGPKLGHRDLKLSNLFALDDYSILLSDFGSAKPLGAKVLFCGALQNAPRECVAACVSKVAYEVKASDDLEMS